LRLRARRPADRLLGGAEETRRAVWSGVGGSEGVGEGVAGSEPSAAGEGFAGNAEGDGSVTTLAERLRRLVGVQDHDRGESWTKKSANFCELFTSRAGTVKWSAR